MSYGGWRRERALKTMSSMDPPAAVEYDRRLIGEALIGGSAYRFEALMWISNPQREIDFCAANVKEAVGGGAHGPLLEKLDTAGLIEVIPRGDPIRRYSTTTPGKVYVTEEPSGAGTYYRSIEHLFWSVIWAFHAPLDNRARQIEAVAVGHVVDDLLAMSAEFDSEREDEDDGTPEP